MSTFTITVTYGGTERVVPASDSETILEVLEAHGLDVQYHCRDGFCGACRCILAKGSVVYTTDPLAFIDDNEFLPCCSKASSDLHITVA